MAVIPLLAHLPLPGTTVVILQGARVALKHVKLFCHENIISSGVNEILSTDPGEQQRRTVYIVG